MVEKTFSLAERLMEKYVCSQQEEILCPSFWWVQKTVTYCSAGSIEYTFGCSMEKNLPVLELKDVFKEDVFERELALLVALQGESIWKGCSGWGDVH